MAAQKLKLLFVFSRNRWRSPTAERIFARSKVFDVRSRGLSASAVRRVSDRDVDWADAIFVMESGHKRRLAEACRDGSLHTPIHVLDIPDEYEFMDPELVDQIRGGVESVVGPT